ncbi:RloB family protein [Corynebacterium aquatimens]|uniref:23S rRNA U2552 (Ribose-2'-O)-methylase RlmE/FtsJ n=1 Tax=Corynebacterium aquatimens TaxID=1190508 RepID=A0A931DZ99_9CORY|nr:23S rRNA U2552 (ribose-2'-O)-methylase RlmE/FtsJ [Corynebacterium aquatimens]WJY65672.1 hypothetical protein CAQUA_04795 [Corynebacterium aquatimens]
MAKRGRRRGKAHRKQNDPLLIAVQGRVTEKEYFERLTSSLRSSAVRVIIIDKDPVTMVIEARKNAKRSEVREFYCVFDVDDTSPESIRTAVKLANQNSDSRAFCVISNECFEGT